MLKRLKRYGKLNSRYAESNAFGTNSGKDAMLQLIICDGVHSRAHRKNLLNPELKEIGCFTGPHSQEKTMTTVTLADSFKHI